MKLKKFIGILTLLLPLSLFAQESSLGITGGYVNDGYGALASYYKVLGSKSDLHISAFISFAEDKQENATVPYTDLSLNVGYFYKIVQDRYNRFGVSIGGGGLIGYEIINGGDKELDSGAIINGESQLVYGAFVGAEANYYLSDAFALVVNANEYYHVVSDLGNTAFYAGFGIKYTLF